MSDPVTYTFYGTTVPVLQNLAKSAISILTAAKNERAKAAADGTSLPTDQELLDAQLGDMLPFRMQPILLAKFAVVVLQDLQLTGPTTYPALDPSFTSLGDVLSFFEALRAGFDGIDATAYNASAEKSAEVYFEAVDVRLRMTGLADYFHGFVVPNAYFHLNAMYMLLRSKGFVLGKQVYIGCFMSEQQLKDWAPLKAARSKE